MAESCKHVELIERIVNILVKMDGISEDLIRAEDHKKDTITIQTYEGFRPDVYYDDGITVAIGEAKTTNDLNNLHSESQLVSYIKHLRSCQSPNKILILGIEWCDLAEAKNMLRDIGFDSIKTIIVNDFNYTEELK